MERDLTKLMSSTFDLLVVGAGIYGACIAWDAVLRGLSVALVEKNDFGHATSANSLKTVHGGLRYLQHADFKRMRESIRERTTLMRVAPHLVHPLPCLMPTYGHQMKGREMMAAALLVNDIISFDRNRLDDPQKHLPGGRIISKRECLDIIPGLATQDLTGGAVWYDSQMYNSVANYVEATGFLREKDSVTGITAQDNLTGNQFEIRARSVVNATGPWVDRLLGSLNGSGLQLGYRLAKAINVATRPLFDEYAVGIWGQQDFHDKDAVLNEGGRLFFITPWRNQSLIGTIYSAYEGDPDEFHVTREAVKELIDEINHIYLPAKLTLDDVVFVYGGLVPISGTDEETGTVKRAKHYQIRDHRDDGLSGLISVLGVKYTTARDVAEKVVDHVFGALGEKPPPSCSATTPLYGGRIGQFDSYLTVELNRWSDRLAQEQLRQLIFNYGTAYFDVLGFFDPSDNEERVLSDEQAVLRAQIIYGIRREMARKLSDVIFRRTELGTSGYPGDETLVFCATVMQEELGRDLSWMQQQIQEVKDLFAPLNIC
jgi:glycerol-3-phosphate dehydrogenase